MSCERAEEDGHQWIAAAHNGYRRRHGVTYARELYLAADGDDMRGEDRLTGRSGVEFAVRFHLHPSVAPALAERGNSAVLRLPGGAAWRLRAVGAEMSLAESVYLGSGEVRPTQQIVLTGTTGRDGATVRWAIKREPAAPKANVAAAAESGRFSRGRHREETCRRGTRDRRGRVCLRGQTRKRRVRCRGRPAGERR